MAASSFTNSNAFEKIPLFPVILKYSNKIHNSITFLSFQNKLDSTIVLWLLEKSSVLFKVLNPCDFWMPIVFYPYYQIKKNPDYCITAYEHTYTTSGYTKCTVLFFECFYHNFCSSYNIKNASFHIFILTAMQLISKICYFLQYLGLCWIKNSNISSLTNLSFFAFCLKKEEEVSLKKQLFPFFYRTFKKEITSSGFYSTIFRSILYYARWLLIGKRVLFRASNPAISHIFLKTYIS